MRQLIGLLLLAAAPSFAENNFAQKGREPGLDRAGRQLPLFFIPNAGQMDPAVRYAVQTPEMQAGFGADFAWFQVRRTHFLARFLGALARTQTTLRGEQCLPGRANFLTRGERRDWRTDLPTYARIRYQNLYPGIDAIYSGAGNRVKAEFIVAPGANPGQIQIEYAEPAQLSIDAAGSLLVTLGDVPASDQLREEPRWSIRNPRAADALPWKRATGCSTRTAWNLKSERSIPPGS